MPFGVWVVHMIGILTPFLGLVTGVVLFWSWGFTWVDLVLLVAMYILTGLGITVGYHRLFTHHAFETNPVMQFLLGVLGSMSMQGPLFDWVALHRRHHQHSDHPGDPHTPHDHGSGLAGLLRGFWHAHLGWVFRAGPADTARYAKDLRQSRVLRVVNALFPLWVALGLLLPAAVGGLVSGSWLGAVLGLVWGGLVRVFLVHHMTWCVNSVCHLWGMRPFRSDDHSCNNFIFGILSLGEGWHNTHHAFPTSARHGLRWWQFDISYYTIRVLAWFRLAWNVKVPSKQAQTAQQA